jgi:uncharacterized damage-inducible protein DinB
MSDATIRPAYSSWLTYNQRWRDRVAAMTEEQLATQPSPDRWPLWATVGHAACQRVFWLCVFAGEPGAETTPFPNSAFNCPGDDDLEHVWSGERLADALDSTFRIIETCLDRWTIDMLDEVLRRPQWDESWVHRRGAVIQRVFAHDVYHVAEVNDALSTTGLPLIDLWDQETTER